MLWIVSIMFKCNWISCMVIPAGMAAFGLWGLGQHSTCLLCINKLLAMLTSHVSIWVVHGRTSASHNYAIINYQGCKHCSMMRKTSRITNRKFKLSEVPSEHPNWCVFLGHSQSIGNLCNINRHCVVMLMYRVK